MVLGTKYPFGVVCPDGNGFSLENAMNKMTGYPKVYGTLIHNLSFDRVNSKAIKN